MRGRSLPPSYIYMLKGALIMLVLTMRGVF